MQKHLQSELVLHVCVADAECDVDLETSQDSGPKPHWHAKKRSSKASRNQQVLGNCTFFTSSDARVPFLFARLCPPQTLAFQFMYQSAGISNLLSIGHALVLALALLAFSFALKMHAALWQQRRKHSQPTLPFPGLFLKKFLPVLETVCALNTSLGLLACQHFPRRGFKTSMQQIPCTNPRLIAHQACLRHI